MSKLVIQNIPDTAMTRLQQLAALHAVSVDTEARAMLMRDIENSKIKGRELLGRIRNFRDSMPSFPEGFDMRETIKEGRE
jgi:plasmid stability protein